MRYRREYGNGLSIWGVAKMPYSPLGFTPAKADGRIWVKIRAYSSSTMLSRGDSFLRGYLLTGIHAADYGGTGRANLDEWAKADFSDWVAKATETQHSPADFDYRECAIEWIPPISGAPSAVSYPGASRITGVRLLPAAMGAHLFVRQSHEKLKSGDDDASAKAGARARQARVLFNPSSYRRRRGRTASRRPESPSRTVVTPHEVNEA